MAVGTRTTAGKGPGVGCFGSGRLCLDLTATGAGPSGACELLDGGGRLADWLVAVGLVPPTVPLDAVDASWVERFRRLRTALDRLLTAELAGCRADAPLEWVNALAAGPPPGVRAVRDEQGRLTKESTGAPACGELLAAVARDAVDLLTDPVARGALRRCEGDHCRRIYLDTSRGRRRRWCSSEVCGNRERVARHRRRHAESGADAGTRTDRA